jgi:AMP-polyphosphate phosphotransferase
MGVELKRFERGEAYAGDYAAALADVQQRLQHLQLAQIVHGERAMLVIDGWDGSGRKAVLRLLAAALDPCHFSVHARASDLDGRHWLSPYWERLPRASETAIFFDSWHSDAVASRVADGLPDKEWGRLSDEINEFESRQIEHGAMLMKLFFHVSPAVQAARLADQAAHPWLRCILNDDAVPRNMTQAAWEQLLARTNTRWAPWTIVDAGDEQSAAITALTAIADELEKKVPNAPPERAHNILSIAGSARG